MIARVRVLQLYDGLCGDSIGSRRPPNDRLLELDLGHQMVMVCLSCVELFNDIFHNHSSVVVEGTDCCQIDARFD